MIMTLGEMHNLLDSMSRTIDHDEFMVFARQRKLITNDDTGMGKLSTAEDFVGLLKDMLAPLQVGDVVMIFNKGVFLVTDTKPEANPDGEHFRALQLDIDGQGAYMICMKKRSAIYENVRALRVRHSAFDMDVIEKCSYERYQCYKRINEIDKDLSVMRG